MKAGTRTLIALGLSALAIGGATTATAGADAGGSGEAAKRADCKITLALARSTFATYIESLSVKNTSCRKGWKLAKAFHECRKENGGKDGRCKSRVNGYSCDEGKRDGVSGVRYRANVVCKDGSKVVKHQYSMSL